MNIKFPSFFKKEKKIQKTKKNWKSGCLLFSVVFLIVFGFTFIIIIIKTGMVQVPILSKAFYQKPQPTRVIRIYDLDGYESEKDILTHDNKIIIEATERDLTAAIRSELKESLEPYFMDDFQIVILPEEMELYSSLAGKPKVAIIFCIKPEISNEKIDFKITRIRIGGLNIHPKPVEFIIRFIAAKKTPPDFEKIMLGFLNKLADIENFEMLDGEMRLSLNMKLESFLEEISLDEEQLRMLEEKFKTKIE